MFTQIFLVIISVSALTRAAAVSDNGLSVEAICERNLFRLCTRDYNPVCGSDGETYSNECMFCFLTRGEIDIVKKGQC